MRVSDQTISMAERVRAVSKSTQAADMRPPAQVEACDLVCYGLILYPPSLVIRWRPGGHSTSIYSGSDDISDIAADI